MRDLAPLRAQVAAQLARDIERAEATVVRAHVERIAGLVDRLVEASGLVGINGVDFVLDADTPYVLEVNPRPTATIELYDDDVEGGTFCAHLRACRGELPDVTTTRQSRAHAIVYAPATLRIPPAVDWPQWCTDLPQAGSTIAAGAPVCSVHACAETCEAARALVLSRHDCIRTPWLEKAA